MEAPDGRPPVAAAGKGPGWNNRIGLRVTCSVFVLIILMGLALLSCGPTAPESGSAGSRSGPESESLDPASRVPKIKLLAPTASYDMRRWEAVLLMATGLAGFGVRRGPTRLSRSIHPFS